MQKKGTAGIVDAIHHGTAQTISYLPNFIATARSFDQLAVLVFVLALLLGAVL